MVHKVCKPRENWEGSKALGGDVVMIVHKFKRWDLAFGKMCCIMFGLFVCVCVPSINDCPRVGKCIGLMRVPNAYCLHLCAMHVCLVNS